MMSLSSCSTAFWQRKNKDNWWMVLRIWSAKIGEGTHHGFQKLLHELKEIYPD
jgi:hypothetical protein